MILETYVCREALSLADDFAVLKIGVASDCLGVVNDIFSGTGDHHGAIVHEITHRGCFFDSVVFVF